MVSYWCRFSFTCRKRGLARQFYSVRCRNSFTCRNPELRQRAGSSARLPSARAGNLQPESGLSLANIPQAANRSYSVSASEAMPTLRRLFVQGARSVMMHRSKQSSGLSQWLEKLSLHKHHKHCSACAGQQTSPYGLGSIVAVAVFFDISGRIETLPLTCALGRSNISEFAAPKSDFRQRSARRERGPHR
jgi:hypothetical protein